MILILILVTILAIVISNPQTSEAEMFLNLGKYNHEYHQQMFLIIRYILMFLTALLMLDHDALFIKPLIAYFKRSKIMVYKIIFHIGIIMWQIIIIYALIIVIPFLITPYYQFNLQAFVDFLVLIPDYLILSIILLIFVRDHRKVFSFLILILFVVVTFIQEDSNNLLIGYFIPLSSSKVFETNLGYYYLGVYLALLIYLYVLVSLNENI